MIKHSIFFLLITFLFTGCAERGHTIEPTPAKQSIVKTNSSKVKESQRATQKVISIEAEEDQVDDSTQNTIAGILVFIIGIMVLL